MGGGRDKRKKQKGHATAGKGADKTARKTELNDTKAQRRSQKAAQGTDDDIDAVLASFKLADAAVSAVRVEEDCPPPSARVCGSFTPLPLRKDGEVALFGGEYFDSAADRQLVYGDLFVFNCSKERWRKVVIPNSPPPRNAHQAVAHRHYLWIFGGEVCAPSGQNFKHYRDLWRLDTEAWTWECIPGRGGPSARSGHRMALHRGRLLLFGGFYDAGDTCRYYNDLWLFDTEELRWEQIARPGAGPAPRGGCQMVVHGDEMFLYGGHSVAQQPDGAELETVFDDMWRLDLKTFEWERLKRAGMAPGPRASFGMVAHRKRAVLFGGITDQRGKADRMYSEAHDDLYQFSFESRRWFPCALRKPRGVVAAGHVAQPAVTPPAEQGGQPKDGAGEVLGDAAGQPGACAAEGPPANRTGVLRPGLPGAMLAAGADARSPLYRAIVRIQSRYRGYVVRKAYKTYKLGGKLSEMLYSPAAYGVDFSGRDLPRPKARANAHLAVVGNTLWLMGGLVEIATTDVTLDDLWRLDLSKMDGWTCIKENTGGEAAFKEEQGSDWETGEDEGDDDQEGDDED